MQQPFLAMIVPVSGGGESGGHPSHPIYHPGHPDHGRPIDPGFGRPGGGGGVDPGWGVGGGAPPSWGGGWGSGNRPDNSLPGSGARPDHGLPDPPQPKGSLHAALPESSIPSHPDKPNPDDGEWVLVALGERNVSWAWMTSTPAPSPK